MKNKNDFKAVFSLRLKQLMSENNETIYTLSSVVNLSPSTISRYTKGLMTPKIPTIQILAQHFMVDPSWLMGASNERTVLISASQEKEIDKQVFSVCSLLPLASKLKLLSFGQYLYEKTKQKDKNP